MNGADMNFYLGISDTDQAHIKIIKVDEGTDRKIFHDPISGKEVLDITSSATGGHKFNMLDIGFWKFTIDGQFASLQDLGDYSQFKGVHVLLVEQKLNFNRR